MEKIKAILRNKWFGFIFWSLLYILWFVIWTGNLWLLLGELVIVDLYFTHFLSRLIGRRNREWCRRSPTYKFIYEWVNAIVFATVVASLIHIFVFQMYVIPSSSMESSLLIGDYLYVSKVAYGPQMPNTPVSFPFVHHTMPFSQTKKSFSECIRWPYHRLKGLRSIERNDVVVFNFPAGDTVLLQRQDATYYDVLREYQRTLGARAGREKLFRDYTVITRPVDKRENYIKRCVAIAGDSLKIVGGEVYVNDEPQAPVAGKQYMYTVMTSSPLSKYAIDKLGITEWSGGNGSNYYMLLDDERAEELRRMGNVLAVERFIYEEPNREVYPHDLTLGWNQDNYGPIWIPARGATIPLTPENMRLYRRCIEVYEGNRVEELPDGRVLLNGQPAADYTFRLNYYWMMGDNRHKEKSSKFLAFAYPVADEEEIRSRLEALRKRYYDATHHCYAWRLGPHGEAFRANDDGEPSSTAGRPILGQLLSHETTDCLIVVVRYFGGTKLGVPGLIAAYKESAAEVLAAARIVQRTVDRRIAVTFSYAAMNDIMRIVKEEQPAVESQRFDNLSSIVLRIRASRAERLTERLRKVEGATIET